MAKGKTENNNKTIKTVLFFIVILVLISLNLVVFINEHSDKKVKIEDTNEYVPQNIVRQIADDNTIEQSMQNNISQQGERNRCQTYIGEFLTWIEDGNYIKAYNTLNKDFKTNYFPSVDEFKTYVTTHFPKNSVLEYVDISRQDPYYIVTVKMNDDVDRSFTTLTERFVVKENGNNDFEISFQIQ